MSSLVQGETEIAVAEDGIMVCEEMVVTVAAENSESEDYPETEQVFVIMNDGDDSPDLEEAGEEGDLSPDYKVKIEEEVPVKKKRGRPKKIITDPRAREFCCEHCGKTFKQQNVFRVHTRIHTGERPYQCERCGMSFNQIGTLKDHQKIHTGEKPYACEFCPSRFTNKTRLTRHLRTHTGERPYKCEYCQVSSSHCYLINSTI